MATITKLDNPKTGPARYRIRVFNGYDPESGKKRVITETVRGETAAKDRVAELEGLRAKKMLPRKRTKETLSEYLRRWLDVKEGQVRARTATDYRNICRRYIFDPPEGAPRIGELRLTDLSHEPFERLYVWLREQGKAPRTIQYLHAILHMALKDAAKKGTLTTNPTTFADRPKRDVEGEERESVRAMNREQAAAFLSAAREDRYSALFHVLLLGGLRPSEALGLGWQHVDFESGRVTIERTLTRVGVKGWKLVPTKTKRSRRSVTLPAVAMRELRSWRAKQAEERLQLGEEYEDHGLVFTTEWGKPLDASNLYARNFRRIMSHAKLGTWREEPLPGAPGPRGLGRFLPAFRLYDLRHTHATLGLLDGINPKVMSERLGHSTAAFTMDVYSHVLPTMQADVADRFDAMFTVGA